MHPVAELALEWWRALPADRRTEAELLLEVNILADSYGLSAELRREVRRQALVEAYWEGRVDA